MTTYNGPLAQDNTWTATWEEFWIRGMQRLFAFEKEARGPSEELEQLIKPYFEKVCPRPLRPLGTEGRYITPVLIHRDLWLGNMAVKAGTAEPFIFDSSAFWGHNECKPDELPSSMTLNYYLGSLILLLSRLGTSSLFLVKTLI